MRRNIETASMGLSDEELSTKQERLYKGRLSLDQKAEKGNAKLDRAFDTREALEDQIGKANNPIARLGLEAITNVHEVAVDFHADNMLDINIARLENAQEAKRLVQYSGDKLQTIAKKEMDDSLAARSDAA